MLEQYLARLFTSHRHLSHRYLVQPSSNSLIYQQNSVSGFGNMQRVHRVIELMCCRVDRKFFTSQPLLVRLPSVLRTSRGSGEVGLAHYHLSFGTEKYPPGTYFNPMSDITYLAPEITVIKLRRWSSSFVNRQIQLSHEIRSNALL